MSRLLVSALSGVLCLLGASQSALADCDADTREAAEWTAQEGLRRGQDCVANMAPNGTWFAECRQPSTDPNGFSYFEAEAELDDTMGCEVIRTADGRYVPQCDSWAHPTESAACEAFAYMYGAGNVDDAYENCMTIALHTPGAVR